MRIGLGVILLFAVACENGCSAVDNVRCRGVYRSGNQDNEASIKAVLGFKVVRASFFGNLVSQTKDWKGFVDVSYVSDPYTYGSESGGAILEITNDSGGYISAETSEKKRDQTLFYDGVDGLARYSDSQNNIEKTFSGLCQQER